MAPKKRGRVRVDWGGGGVRAGQKWNFKLWKIMWFLPYFNKFCTEHASNSHILTSSALIMHVNRQKHVMKSRNFGGISLDETDKMDKISRIVIQYSWY